MAYPIRKKEEQRERKRSEKENRKVVVAIKKTELHKVRKSKSEVLERFKKAFTNATPKKSVEKKIARKKQTIEPPLY